jgi:hypothetical protein
MAKDDTFSIKKFLVTAPKWKCTLLTSISMSMLKRLRMHHPAQPITARRTTSMVPPENTPCLANNRHRYHHLRILLLRIRGAPVDCPRELNRTGHLAYLATADTVATKQEYRVRSI